MKHRTLSFAVGLFCGIFLFGGGAIAYAAGIVGERSSQIFYLDGNVIQMEAYAINGNNYVKLRDVGQAVNFGVEYVVADNSVHIDSIAPYTEEVKPKATAAPITVDSMIAVPQSDAQFIPQVGDVIRCDDGTNYTITDVSRWDKSMFASGPLPPLPAPTCDWSQFPKSVLPEVRVNHFVDDNSDELFILNLYETKRMEYTLYNLIGANAETWNENGLMLSVKGNPIVSVSLTMREDRTPQSFWPWKESNISNLFNSRPVSQYHVQAWDHFNNGKFLETQYLIQSF